MRFKCRVLIGVTGLPKATSREDLDALAEELRGRTFLFSEVAVDWSDDGETVLLDLVVDDLDPESAEIELGDDICDSVIASIPEGDDWDEWDTPVLNVEVLGAV